MSEPLQARLLKLADDIDRAGCTSAVEQIAMASLLREAATALAGEGSPVSPAGAEQEKMALLLRALIPEHEDMPDAQAALMAGSVALQASSAPAAGEGSSVCPGCGQRVATMTVFQAHKPCSNAAGTTDSNSSAPRRDADTEAER